MSNLQGTGTLSGTISRGGGSGTTDYSELTNKPKINNVELSETLSSLEIDGTKYSIGGSSITIDSLYSADAWATPITLTESIFDYDFIIITGYASSGTGYMVSNIYKTSDLSLNKNIGYSDDIAFNWWKITANDTLTDGGHSGTYYLKAVYGIKL